MASAIGLAANVPSVRTRLDGADPLPARQDPTRQAAEKFEAMFLSTIIDRMFASLPVDGPFGGGQAEATYRTFLADAYADALAHRGGIGISDALHGELIRLQEASNS